MADRDSAKDFARNMAKDNAKVAAEANARAKKYNAPDPPPTPEALAEMENQEKNRKLDAEDAKGAKEGNTTRRNMGEKLFAKGGSIRGSDKKFRRGGMPAAINKQNTQHGSMDMPFKSLKKFSGMKEGGMPMKDGKPAFMMKKKMMGGGMTGYAKGGGIESKGKTKGTVVKMASGGNVSSRADGIAQRGKTKTTMC